MNLTEVTRNANRFCGLTQLLHAEVETLSWKRPCCIFPKPNLFTTHDHLYFSIDVYNPYS
jgi:hypothetical protein